MKIFWLACFLIGAHTIAAQDFEFSGVQDLYRGEIGETIIAPLKFRNPSDKPVTLIIRRTVSQIGGMQKNYYCIDNRCLDAKADEYSIRLDPKQTVSNFYIALEAGLSSGASVVHYVVFNKNFPADAIEFDLNFNVNERSEREQIFSSKEITLFDLYPNPISDYAQMDYKIHNERTKAKIILHNLLGSLMEELPLDPHETRLKIRVESLDAGIYFYTLYVDNESMITRKLIIKK